MLNGENTENVNKAEETMPPSPLHPGKDKNYGIQHAAPFPPFSLVSSCGPIRCFVAVDVDRGAFFPESSLEILFLHAVLQIFSQKKSQKSGVVHIQNRYASWEKLEISLGFGH